MFSRHAHNRANPYPYPTNAHPTPHQIFHLPRTATVQQVKSRCQSHPFVLYCSHHARTLICVSDHCLHPDYELVRIYHPDSSISRALPPDRAQARFHAITAAYDALRGKRPLSDSGEPIVPRRDFHDLGTAMWRAKQQRKAELNVSVIDDKWKDRMMLGLIFLVSSEDFQRYLHTNM